MTVSVLSRMLQVRLEAAWIHYAGETLQKTERSLASGHPQGHLEREQGSSRAADQAVYCQGVGAVLSWEIQSVRSSQYLAWVLLTWGLLDRWWWVSQGQESDTP